LALYSHQICRFFGTDGDASQNALEKLYSFSMLLGDSLSSSSHHHHHHTTTVPLFSPLHPVIVLVRLEIRVVLSALSPRARSSTASARGKGVYDDQKLWRHILFFPLKNFT
jgi:hypothetical protein